ncbi:TPA: hypothetical protein I7221_21750 [Vibrio vulnificus]|nr:hypothetical protein [Vibrio vulnificus]HAT8558583.1 hypothetical protein [Vibrio vulnificus]HDY8100275.1 hypothetical protein [Vibrio vulnificus]
MSEAKEYNRIRRIIFSTVHKNGFDTATEYLIGYYKRGTLNKVSYVGLRAELEFYREYHKEFVLTVAGDMGEHADFSGVMGNTRNPVRFDVTTNADYKQLKDYEKFVCDGYDYKIAIYDESNWNIIDVLDLSFPKCNRCGDSNTFSLALLKEGNFNSRGEPTWHNDQDIVDFCPSCGELETISELYSTNIRPSFEIYNEIPDDLYSHEEKIGIVTSELKDTVKYLSKTNCTNLVGIMQHGLEQAYKYEEQLEGFYFPYLRGVVARQFPDFHYI